MKDYLPTLNILGLAKEVQDFVCGSLRLQIPHSLLRSHAWSTEKREMAAAGKCNHQRARSQGNQSV